MSDDRTTAASRRSGAIMVAPLDATWPDEVAAFLTGRAYAVARMNRLSMIGFLMTSAGVAGLIVDASLLDGEAAAACIRAITRAHAQISVVVVGALTEQETRRLPGIRLSALVPRPPAEADLEAWFPDLRGAPARTCGS